MNQEAEGYLLTLIIDTFPAHPYTTDNQNFTLLFCWISFFSIYNITFIILFDISL